MFKQNKQRKYNINGALLVRSNLLSGIQPYKRSTHLICVQHEQRARHHGPVDADHNDGFFGKRLGDVQRKQGKPRQAGDEHSQPDVLRLLEIGREAARLERHETAGQWQEYDVSEHAVEYNFLVGAAIVDEAFSLMLLLLISSTACVLFFYRAEFHLWQVTVIPGGQHQQHHGNQQEWRHHLIPGGKQFFELKSFCVDCADCCVGVVLLKEFSVRYKSVVNPAEGQSKHRIWL